MQRRQFLTSAAMAGMSASTAVRSQAAAHVVVIGAGFGGATAAKYVREFLPTARITLIEPNAEFIACPLSNRVLYGGMSLRDITRPYDRFVSRHDINWVQAFASDIDTDKRVVIAGGQKISYDRLIVSPGVEFMYDKLPGLQSAASQRKIVHAWKAGEQTTQLRKQLTDLKSGGVVAIHIPKVPYRCPPGPYERASLIAFYLAMAKPKAKLLVFDSNPEIQSKKDLFAAAWSKQYKDVIEYIPNAEIKSVDTESSTIEMDLHGKVRADVWNVIPPQRAGAIARKAGLVTVNDRWCGVDYLSYESLAVKGVHVIGDSVAGSPGMPKSGHMANQEAKVCAAAVVAALTGKGISSNPIIANTCYSFVSQSEVIHVASVHRYDPASKQMVVVKGAGGTSTEPSVAEGIYAMAWANNILNDAFN
jgi:NADH dehydrogenase FAD-containing subunit